jgi:multisubunit Na+/H+ antiporter MnhF subunit
MYILSILIFLQVLTWISFFHDIFLFFFLLSFFAQETDKEKKESKW